MQIHEYITPLYGTEFTIIIYEEPLEIKEYFMKLNFEMPDNCDGWVYKIDDMIYCVFYAMKEGYPTPGIIAHEAKHLVNNIFIDIRHELDLYNDEPEAYLLGWIVNRIHDCLNQFKQL